MKNFFFTLIFLLPVTLPAQTGPGGVGSSASVLLWLDGKRVNADGSNPTIGSTVSTWYDKSGNGINVTQNIANVATYSATGVTFNNTGYLQGSDATFPTGNAARTVIVCASSPSTNADDVLFFYGSTVNNQSYGLLKIQNDNGTNNNGIRSFFHGNDQDLASTWTTLRIVTSTYTSNTQVTHVDNNAGTTRTPTGTINTTLGAQGVQIGGWSSYGGLHSQATIAEVILYNKVLNPAERIIVNNYLSAKNGLTLSANDLYDNDDVGNGNFDYDVAGIGRAGGATETNTDASASIVRINNPSGLGNNEYYIWGHDNGALTPSSAGVPTGVQSKLIRTWRGSETGTITNFDVRFDLTGMGTVVNTDLRLLIDTNNDGSFADETVAGGGIVSGASLVSGATYQFTGVTGLNNDIRFTLGTINTSTTPLPVELLSFSAKEDNGKVNLQWITEKEINNDHFTLERSEDGQHFEWLNEVPAGKNSSSKQTYKMIDYNPFVGVSYYRLSQTDYDGTTEYFPLVAVNVSLSEFSIAIHPNPSDGDFTLELKGISDDTGNSTVTIIDAQGKEVYALIFSPAQTVKSSITISPQSKLSPGVYAVKISTVKHQRIQKLVIR